MIPRIGRDNWVVPDIVIHQSETIDKNLIAVEIKTARNTSAEDLYTDLQKLDCYTDPHKGLGFLVGILLGVNFNARSVIESSNNGLGDRISDCLEKGPRTAIWNIESAVPVENSGRGELSESCLAILRADDVRRLISQQRRSAASDGL
jgi:hypothetical protein